MGSVGVVFEGPWSSRGPWRALTRDCAVSTRSWRRATKLYPSSKRRFCHERVLERALTWVERAFGRPPQTSREHRPSPFFSDWLIGLHNSCQTASIDIQLQQTSSSNSERAGSSKCGLRRASRRRDQAMLAAASLQRGARQSAGERRQEHDAAAAPALLEPRDQAVPAGALAAAFERRTSKR